jgi:serine/threonine protein kinase
MFLLDRSVERVKVFDFCVARPEQGAVALTVSGEVLGTPEYMAPEQATGDSSVDGRADIYSLGRVLYRCLTGRTPYQGQNGTAVLLRVVLESAHRLDDLRVSLPTGLVDLVEQMVAKLPSERPEEASTVAERLATIGSALSASAEPPCGAGSEAGKATRLGVPRREPGPTQSPIGCVVLARPQSTDRDRGWLRSVAAPVEDLGGQLRRLVDGTVVATFANAESASEQAGLGGAGVVPERRRSDP